MYSTRAYVHTRIYAYRLIRGGISHVQLEFLSSEGSELIGAVRFFATPLNYFSVSRCITRDMLIIVITDRARETRVHNAGVLSFAQYRKTNCRRAYYS